MKKIIKFVKTELLIIRCFVKRLYNNFITKETVTDRGVDFYNYLTKVIVEDYQPVTMAECMFENAFNKDDLTGDQRRSKAYPYFFFFAERLPFKQRG